jgi:hypothetical protein
MEGQAFSICYVGSTLDQLRSNPKMHEKVVGAE